MSEGGSDAGQSREEGSCLLVGEREEVEVKLGEERGGEVGLGGGGEGEGGGERGGEQEMKEREVVRGRGTAQTGRVKRVKEERREEDRGRGRTRSGRDIFMRAWKERKQH